MKAPALTLFLIDKITILHYCGFSLTNYVHLIVIYISNYWICVVGQEIFDYILEVILRTQTFAKAPQHLCKQFCIITTVCIFRKTLTDMNLSKRKSI